MAVGAMLVLKIVFRVLLVGAFTPTVITLFTIVDSAMVMLATPWASLGVPRPERSRALRRVLGVSITLLFFCGLVNLMLQLPLLAASSSDTVLLVIRIFIEAIPQSVLNGPALGPVWAVFVWLIAAGVGYGWLMVRLPPPAKVPAPSKAPPPGTRGVRPRPGPPARPAPRRRA